MSALARRLTKLERGRGTDLARMTDEELESRIVSAALACGFDAETAAAIPHLSDQRLDAMIAEAKAAIQNELVQ